MGGYCIIFPDDFKIICILTNNIKPLGYVDSTRHEKAGKYNLPLVIHPVPAEFPHWE